MKFSFKDYIRKLAVFWSFTPEYCMFSDVILKGKLHFSCSACCYSGLHIYKIRTLQLLIETVFMFSFLKFLFLFTFYACYISPVILCLFFTMFVYISPYHSLYKYISFNTGLYKHDMISFRMFLDQSNL